VAGIGKSQNVSQTRRRARRRQRHHSLVIFRIGQPVDLPAILKSQRNALLARQLHDFFDSRVLPPLRDGDAIDRAPRLQRFLNGVNPSKFVHGKHSLQMRAHS